MYKGKIGDCKAFTTNWNDTNKNDSIFYESFKDDKVKLTIKIAITC